MIALVPSTDSLDLLAQAGGLDKSDLHVTLAYLGEASNWSPDSREEVVALCRQMASTQDVPTGNAWAVGYFNPASEWECATYLVSGVELENVMKLTRSKLNSRFGADNLIPVQHVPWVPHVTVGYGMLPEQVDKAAIGSMIPFEAIRVAFAGENVDIPFVPAP